MAHSMALMTWLYILQAERRHLIYTLNWCLSGTLKSSEEKCYITAKGYYKISQAKKKKGRSSEFIKLAFRH